MDGLPRIGETIAGKYRLDGVIGEGGMGVVMGAFDLSLGRPVAIKFLASSRARREGATARFVREARAAASMQSEHVVRVFEVGSLPNGSPFIVMEFLRGGDLHQLLASRGPLPIQEAVDYVLQVTEALGEAHGRGIVHRDLKPQNLFLTQSTDGSPCVKVVDFGISKAIDESAPNLTATDTVMGTPLYMSPEQVRSLKNVDHRTDIWSMGAILFELVTRTPLWDAPSASALCAMIAMDAPVPLRARRPDAPPGLEAVILQCLNKDAAGRYPDVAALANALAPFGSDRGRQSATRTARVVHSSRGGDLVVSVPSSPASDPNAPTAGASTMGPGPQSLPYSPTAMGPPTGTPPPGMSGPLPGMSGPPPGMSGPPPGMSGMPVAPGFGPSGYPPANIVSNHPPGTYTTQSTYTTQDTWQRNTQQGKKGSGLGVAIVLGGIFGLLLLGGALVAIVLYMQGGADTPKPQPIAQGGQPPAPPPTTTLVPLSPTATPTPVTPVNPTTPTPGPTARPTAAPTAAPTATPTTKPTTPTAVDAGAPTPKPDDNAEKAKRAQSECDFSNRFIDQNPNKEQGATTAKNRICGRAYMNEAARCERDTCRRACDIVKDQMCVNRINTLNQMYPPKY